MNTYRHTVFAALLIVSAFQCAYAAPDANGYTAQYECRAGNPNCDVDVEALSDAPCEQTVYPSDPDWSKIEDYPQQQVFCVAAGNHTGKGTLYINSSGSANARKVLRCVTASGGQCADPWTAPSNDRATVNQIEMNGGDYWILDRIAVDISGGPWGIRLTGDDSNHNVVNRSYIFDGGAYWVGMVESQGGSNNTVQNSVLGPCSPAYGGGNYGSNEIYGINIESGVSTNFRVVNNQIFDCNKNIFVGELTAGDRVPGLVVENNDLYWSPEFTSDEGVYKDSVYEYIFNMKSGATSSNYGRVLHNRMWGARAGHGEGSCLATSVGSPPTVQPYNGADWLLVQNNICMDAQQGFVTTGYGTSVRLTNHSYVGNILFDLRTSSTSFGTHGVIWSLREDNESYFNSFIGVRRTNGSEATGWMTDWDHSNSDIKCNVMIDSDGRLSQGGDQTGSEFDCTAYYGTPNSGESTSTSRSIVTRTDNTSYMVGTVIRRTSDFYECTSSTDPDCFLYMATNNGTSGYSPTFCWTLGCTFQDGGVTWQAIRGPYVFQRKLKTGAEQIVIPYARVHVSAPEVGLDAGNVGSRPDIGVNNDASGTGTGILAKDVAGTTRTGTPGAFEAVTGEGGGGGGGGGQNAYGGSMWPIPGVVQAEDYDTGGQDIAFNDTTLANQGGAYRTGAGEAPDVEATQDTGGGYDVGWVTPGEWLEYTVNVQAASTYDIGIRHASAGPGGTVHVEFASVDKTNTIALPDTGGWQNWSTVTVPDVTLAAGEQVMRLAFDTGNDGWLANINYINITPSGSTPPPPCYAPYLGAPVTLPGTIEAENYDFGGEGCAYHDNSASNEPGAYRNDGVDIEVTQDIGGGYDVGWVTPGEWLQYSVNVASAGTYNLDVRYATQGFGGTMHVEFDGINKTGSIALNDTGGWQTWSTVSVPVSLSVGPQLVRVVFDSGNSQGWLGNINYVRISTGTPQSSLNGSLATPPAAVNLTTDGPADWVHWGLNDASSINRKSGVTPTIGNYALIGTSTVQQYNDNPTGFSWSDGTPTANVTNTTTYLYVTGVGNGFELSVPADTTLRTVKVYVGVWAAQGQVTAALSDNSAASYTDNSLNHPTDHQHGVYTFQYRAASSGQSLVIRWMMIDSYRPQGSVTWQAGTLAH